MASAVGVDGRSEGQDSEVFGDAAQRSLNLLAGQEPQPQRRLRHLHVVVEGQDLVVQRSVVVLSGSRKSGDRETNLAFLFLTSSARRSVSFNGVNPVNKPRVSRGTILILRALNYSSRCA